jgi:hypothetical protein
MKTAQIAIATIWFIFLALILMSFLPDSKMIHKSDSKKSNNFKEGDIIGQVQSDQFVITVKEATFLAVFNKYAITDGLKVKFTRVSIKKSNESGPQST